MFIWSKVLYPESWHYPFIYNMKTVLLPKLGFYKLVMEYKSVENTCVLQPFLDKMKYAYSLDQDYYSFGKTP